MVLNYILTSRSEKRVGKAFDQLALHVHGNVVDRQIGDRVVVGVAQIFRAYGKYGRNGRVAFFHVL